MASDKIVIRGAREHNLKNVDLEIPREKLVLFTGLSGSGKSSLAFDTIYAEGQRRYVESLSAYARQFLGLMEKPDVDQIDGLSPAISIDQKSASRNPRSTVGTVTEIHDHLRLLYARVGKPHCPECGRPIATQSVQQMSERIQALTEGTRLMILAPLIRDRKGEHQGILEDVRKAGFARVRVNGEVHDIDDDIKLGRYHRHTVEVVVDRIIVRHDDEDDSHSTRIRLIDSLETALQMGNGIATAAIVDGEEMMFSEHFACVHCGLSFGELEPRSFSFNSPHGACPKCDGIGVRSEFDPELIVPDKSLTLSQGAIAPWFKPGRDGTNWYSALLEAMSTEYDIPLDVPFGELSDKQQKLILNGTRGKKIKVQYRSRSGRKRTYPVPYEGVLPHLKRRYSSTSSDYVRNELEQYMATRPCPSCDGARLKPEARAVTINERSIDQISADSIEHAAAFIRELLREDDDAPLTERERMIGRQLLKETNERLSFLVDVGLDYLTLDRGAASLSGGEAQRIRLATQIGSRLMGVLYILDEPSIGLHQRDNARLIQTLISLRDLGNTLVVVEHDEETIRAADWVVDIGPGAGEHGGHIIAAGDVTKIEKAPDSITGQYLSGKKQIEIPKTRREGNGQQIVIRGARENNLKNVDVEFPLGSFICVTGVSGSGKSTLITDTLTRRLAQVLHRARQRPGHHDTIEGIDQLDKVIEIDQSPIGRTPRSNPATYTGAFTPIRDLFASMPESKTRGYKPGRFSFNVKGGRCEACQGEGIIAIEMQFLPDIHVPCEVCKGRRYNEEALEITYRDRDIADVLNMTVEEALDFFENIPAIRNKMQTLFDVGLGYIKLGQPATTLSGGEAQRIKLSSELSRRATGKTLYILDEPTTGLHFADIERLLSVLQRLTDNGNTVLVIEHNLDVIKSADWLIDLGPEGGQGGGQIIGAGTPEHLATIDASYTGQALRTVLPVEAIAAD